MLTRLTVGACVVAALAFDGPTALAQERAAREQTPVPAREASGESPADGPRFTLELTAALRVGAMLGHTVWHENAALVEGAVDVRPSLLSGPFRLRVPIGLSHSQTFGASLPELRASLDVEGRYRPSPRLRVEVSGGVLGVWRPGWPDLYQPLLTGAHAPTSRNSYFEGHLGAAVAGIPIRHHHARLSYEYASADYADDAAYDPVDAPTHLVPSDHGDHTIDAAWHYLGEGWKLGGRLEVVRRNWYSTFARDSGTGLTHAGPGGLPPNPLQVVWSVEPSVDAQVEVADGKLKLGGSYGLEVDSDAWQGYYSYVGQHPGLELKWKATRELRIALDAQVSWRDYGSGSYAAGPSHPPLESGSRRWDRRVEVGLDARYRLGSAFALTFEATWEHRRTNFPDYVPGVFPSTQQYDIRWDWDDARVLVGLEYSLDTGSDDTED
jgi:hypothetical protein